VWIGVCECVGDVHLYNTTSSHLLITHNMTRNNSTREIRNYSHSVHPSYKHRAIELLLYEHSQYIKISLVFMKIDFSKAVRILSSTSKGNNTFMIDYFNFIKILLKIGTNNQVADVELLCMCFMTLLICHSPQ